jgi:GT2 family glycosyltransferase
LAAQNASGDILCFIDNDARFRSAGSMEIIIQLFRAEIRLGLITFKILMGDQNELDPTCWIFRRPTFWQNRQFQTFSFTGGGFCINRDVFAACGGFWEQIKYAREEEELSITVISKGYTILFEPRIQISHYSAKKNRMILSERMYINMKNGILIYWRRFPFPISLMTIFGRIVSMTAKSIRGGESNLLFIWRSIPDAIREWRNGHLKRSPVGYSATKEYFLLHRR